MVLVSQDFMEILLILDVKHVTQPVLIVPDLTIINVPLVFQAAIYTLMVHVNHVTLHVLLAMALHHRIALVVILKALNFFKINNAILFALPVFTQTQILGPVILAVQVVQVVIFKGVAQVAMLINF